MKRTAYALLPLCLGLICGLFRNTIWTVTYDPETMLLTNSELLATSHTFAAVCLLICLLAFFRRFPKGVQPVTPAETGDPAARIIRTAAALLVAAAGVLMLKDALTGPIALIPLVMSLFQLLQGGGMLALTLPKQPDARRSSTCLVLCGLAGCYWMVAFYHAFGSCPNAETYLYPILAGLAVMGSWVWYAGFAFRTGEGRKFTLLCLLALLTIPSALSAPLTVPYRLSLLGQLLWFFAACLLLGPEEPEEREEVLPQTEKA